MSEPEGRDASVVRAVQESDESSGWVGVMILCAVIVAIWGYVGVAVEELRESATLKRVVLVRIA